MNKLRHAGGIIGLPIENRMDIAWDMPSSFGFIDHICFHTMKEYWATVVHAGRYIEPVSKKKNISAQEAESLISKLVEEYHSRTPLEFGVIDIDVRLLEKEHHKSVIIMANVLGIDPLYAELREKLGIDIPIPPFYVTLYTNMEHTVRQAPIQAATLEEMKCFHKTLSSDEAQTLKGLSLYGDVNFSY